MQKLGRKTEEWQRAKKRLIQIYQEKGIIKCEWCKGTWILSFHHLDKRSSGKAKHTFKDTRLLCIECHDLFEYDSEMNERLRKLR